MLKFLSGLWIIIAEFFKLPLVFDPVSEVIYHLPVHDVKNLGSDFCKAVIVLLKGFIRLLFARFEFVRGTWSGEYSKIFTEAVPKSIEWARSLSNQARGTVSSAMGKYKTFMSSSPPANSMDWE